jgi:hypothetical protein
MLWTRTQIAIEHVYFWIIVVPISFAYESELEIIYLGYFRVTYNKLCLKKICRLNILLINAKKLIYFSIPNHIL